MEINEEFIKLIPPLSNEEFKQLEKNILADGIRDALVVWERFLVDGHNRLKIAEKHSLKYEVNEMNFADESAAKVWMIDNQQGRRNLSDGWKFELLTTKREILKGIGKETQGTRTDLLSLSDKKLPGHNTQKIIANELGWSTGKVAMADIIMKQSPDVWDKVKSNDISIKTAYQEIKKEEKKHAVQNSVIKHTEDVKDVYSFDVDIYDTNRKFNIIYADPAWRYWEGGEKNQSLHYPTMTIEEIKNLPVNSISDENSILFLWVTFPILKEALETIEAWGFKYSTCGFLWVKKNKNADSWFFGNGSWTRANSEICLIGTKGSVTRMDASISQILDDRIGEHSEKPVRVRKLITDLVGELPRIELFSRNENKDGWFNWGNAI